MLEPGPRSPDRLEKPVMPPRYVKSAMPFCTTYTRITCQSAALHKEGDTHERNKVRRCGARAVRVLHEQCVGSVSRDAILAEHVRDARNEGAGAGPRACDTDSASHGRTRIRVGGG